MQQPTVYDHTNVYDNGGGHTDLKHLITLDYFGITYFENRSAGGLNGLTSINTSPINNSNNLYCLQNDNTSGISYGGTRASQAVNDGNFTIEYFSKVLLGSEDNTSAIFGLGKTGNYWASLIAPKTNNSSVVAIWHNDVQYDYSGIDDTRNWHHYEIDVDNKKAYYFIDGNLLAAFDSLDVDNALLQVYPYQNNRAKMQITQLAIWDYCKHKENFVVNNEPILLQV